MRRPSRTTKGGGGEDGGRWKEREREGVDDDGESRLETGLGPGTVG